MITEDYVSFETAKLLKEKGFDEPCCRNVSRGFISDILVKEASEEPSYPQPTIAMAMKWLRESHKIHICVEIGFDVDNKQYYFFVPSVCRFSDKSGEYETPFGEKEFETYEESCESAIKYCLENLI